MSAALSAPQDYEGRRILDIQFTPAEQPYSRDYLLEILPLKLNQPLRLADVRAAIDRLYATGRYADIDVDAEARDGGVALRFITEPDFFVGRVTAGGVPEPPNPGALVNATRLELGTHFVESSVGAAVENLRQVLQNNGFYQSQISPQFEYDPQTQQVHITFDIESGKRARYARPAITGKPERPPNEVVKATHWHGWLGWKPATESRTQDGLDRVRRSYQKRDRLAAEVSLAKMNFDVDTRRVTPTLQIEAGPKFRVQVAGAKVSKGKLRRTCPVYEEGSVDRDLLVECERNLREYFEAQGFFHTQVDFTADTTNGAGEQVIRFTVNRGERHKLLRVEITGNKYFDNDTIRERMFVRPAAFPQFRHGRYSELLKDRDVEAIVALYRSNGFRDVEVATKVEHGYQGKEVNMAVFIAIKEGPQWLVSSVAVEGASPANEETVRSMLQSGEGQPFSEFNVAIDRENILEHYYNQGYPEATFDWSFQPAKKPHEVDLKFTITEGSRRLIRGVLISGLETTDPALVRERLAFRAGDPLSRAAILETQRRLYNLQIFAKVDTALQNPGGQERDKYVLMQFDESRRYSTSVGAGAEVARIGGGEDFDSPGGQTGFSPRVSFDFTRSNAWGNGHTLSFRSRVSTLQKRGVLSYEAPQFRGSPNLNLLFSAMYDDSRDVRTFSSRRQEGSVQIGQHLSRASTMLYRFTYRRVTVDPQSLRITPGLIPLFSQPVRLGILAGTFIQDRRDDPTDSHRGAYYTVDFGWASRYFGSRGRTIEAEGLPVDFTRFLAHNATYHSVGFGNRYVFARALTFGWLQRLTEETQIPLPERFFAGGPESHRGFPSNQAGPRDLLTGFPLGGRALLVNKLELRFPLLGENIGGVLFHDAGNLYSGLDKLSFRVRQQGLTDFDYMVHAVGFGVRYRTPLGPLRLDLAYTINPPRFVGFKGTREQLLAGRGERGEQRISHFQFHFSLGQSF